MKFSLKDTLKRSANIYNEIFDKILIVILFIYLPINAGLNYYFYESLQTNEDISSLLDYAQIAGIIDLLVGTFAIIIIVKATAAILEKKGSTDMNQLLNFSLKRWLPVVITSVIATILTGLWTLLLIIPGIIFATYWSFAGIIAILENTGGMNALRMSKTIIQGRWWKFFGIQILLALVAIVLVIITESLFVLVPENIYFYTFSDLLFQMIIIFLTINWTVIYFDYKNTNTDEKSK